MIGCTTDYSAGRNRYIGYLITLATRSFKGKRIGLDCSNGSAFCYREERIRRTGREDLCD